MTIQQNRSGSEASRSPRKHQPRGFMDWLFGRTPPAPAKASPNDYLGDIVDGDFSSPSAHHHHNHHRGKES